MTKNRHAAFGTPPGRNAVYGDFSMIASKDYDGAAGRWPANLILDEAAAAMLDSEVSPVAGHGPSRFFYCAKASASERPVAQDGTTHSTVKPLALMSWLVALLSPPGTAHILDPFAGSGTTVEAVLGSSGHRITAIEREEQYIPLIQARIARALAA